MITNGEFYSGGLKMNDDKRMQALDDEFLDDVSGGVNILERLFGKENTGNTGRVIEAPVPTVPKGCVKHEYLPGSNFCRYCGKPK
jgi:hypothetical protein